MVSGDSNFLKDPKNCQIIKLMGDPEPHAARNSLLGRGFPAVVGQQRLEGLDQVLQAPGEVGVLDLICG